MSDKIKQHYKQLFEIYGRDHNAVQYSSRESQYARFDVLLEIADNLSSVADIGCGLGDLLPLLRQKHPQAQYTGYDFVSAFIDDAKAQFSEDNFAQFKQLDILQDHIEEKADYVLLSGMLNNEMEDNAVFTEITLQKMWQAANKGIAFNALSSYVDYQEEGLCYHDPLKLFHFCKTTLSRYVTLRHEYDVKEHSIPFEFTIYVFKK